MRGGLMERRTDLPHEASLVKCMTEETINKVTQFRISSYDLSWCRFFGNFMRNIGRCPPLSQIRVCGKRNPREEVKI